GSNDHPCKSPHYMVTSNTTKLLIGSIEPRVPRLTGLGSWPVTVQRVNLGKNARSIRFNQRFFENLPPAVRTLLRLFEDVIRHARTGAGNAVENPIERNVRIVRKAMSQDSISRSALRRVTASIRMTF